MIFANEIYLPADYTANTEEALARICAELQRQGIRFTVTAQVSARSDTNGYRIDLTGH